jgi:tetratricopeptide (TPR) repeat protein
VRYVLALFVDLHGTLELGRALSNEADLLRLSGQAKEAERWYTYSLAAAAASSEAPSEISSPSSSMQPSSLSGDFSDDYFSDDGNALFPGQSTESAWVGLGQVKLSEQDFAAAANCYRNALAISPRNVKAWTNLGVALVRLEIKEKEEKKKEGAKNNEENKDGVSGNDGGSGRRAASNQIKEGGGGGAGGGGWFRGLSEELAAEAVVVVEPNSWIHCSAMEAFLIASRLSDFDTEPLVNLGLLLQDYYQVSTAQEGGDGQQAQAQAQALEKATECFREAVARAERNDPQPLGLSSRGEEPPFSSTTSPLLSSTTAASAAAAAAAAAARSRRVDPAEGARRQTLSGLLVHLGVSLFEQGDTAASLETFDRAVALDPTNEGAAANAKAVRGAKHTENFGARKGLAF